MRQLPQSRHFSSYDTPTDKHSLLVIQPEYKTGKVESPYVPAECKLEEAVSLVEAISGWTVHAQRVDSVRRPQANTFFGKGKVAELKQFAGNLPVTGIFLNVPRLTPVQHKTLQRMFRKKVFDRFGVVLRIFKERARTKEAKLQVELAEIPYLQSRLVEDEAVAGGGREMGEMAAKHNAYQKRKVALRQELKEIHERRQIMSERRKRHHLPVVAVVGYTNAGKTTLIKALSKDEGMSPEDMLFATLDTTVHAGKLPCGQKVLFVDTIGFVSDLPHELVESFSSTLDDVAHADVLIHIRDVSHPQSYAQKADVMKVLHRLDLAPNLVEGILEAGNKADRMGGDIDESDCPIPISALHGTGLDLLLERLERAVIGRTRRKMWKIVLPTNGPELSWLYGDPEATVCDTFPIIATTEPRPLDNTPDTPSSDGSSEVISDYLTVKAVLTEAACSKFRAKFPHSIRMIEMTR
jgi:GTP-binding protein HflX